MADCYSLRPTENKAVNSDGTKCAVYKPTENKISVPDGGGGSGDGIKTINEKGPDSSGNYQIVADDIPTASETTKGGASFATSEETIAGTVTNKIVTPKTLSDKLGDQTEGKYYRGKGKDKPGEWVDLPNPPTPSYVPIPLEVFISDKVAKANHAYAAIDSKNTLTLQLPPRGSFKRSDILEVENLSAAAFKITLNTDLLIRYDDTVIEDTDGRFLLSAGAGSSIKLRAESTQLWYVVRRDRVTISSGE